MSIRHSIAGLLACSALLLPLSARAQVARDSPAQVAPVGTSSIAGRVMSDEATPQPLRRARVHVQSGGPGAPGWTAATDDDGRYVIRGLPAGRYIVTARKPAWIQGAYGARRPGRAGTPVTLGENQQIGDIDVRLTRGAVITGAVYEASGQPAVGIAVQVLRYSYSELTGERTLGAPSGGSVSQTDSRGIYRAYGLPPGEYVVVATPRVQPAPGAAPEILPMRSVDVDRVLASARASASSGQRTSPAVTPPNPVAYAPVLHPGTADPEAATRVTIGAGEERDGVNINIALVPTATVSGAVTLPSGVTAETVQVALTTPRAALGIREYALGATSRLDPATGRYRFTSLAPGPYTVTARVAPASVNSRIAATTAPWSAVVSIQVSGADVDVPLSLRPGVTVSGRITFEGQTPQPSGAAISGLQIRLQSLPRGPALDGPVASPDAEGRFTFPGLVPGRYAMLYSMGGLDGWWLRATIVNGQDVRDVPLEVASGTDILDWTWTFTDQPTEVAGTLQDASGRAATEYFVVIFPADRSLRERIARHVRQVRPAIDGTFTMRGLPPGNYLLAALTDVLAEDLADQAFLRELEPAAVAIRVVEGQKTTQDIRIK